jgi:hypothetical protein
VRTYERETGTVIDPAELVWYQAVVFMRALVEVSGWVHAGQQDARGDHPWMQAAPVFAARLTALTGVAVRPR